MAANNNNHGGMPPPLQIQHIDDWLRFNGLRSPDDEPPEAPEYGSFLSPLNRSEAHAKHEAQERYQKQVHDSIFREALEAEQQQEVTRRRCLEAWKEETMQIMTKEKTFCVPLRPLAAACDTIFTMASSRRYMWSVLKGRNSGEETNKLAPVQLSLEEYSASSVHEFLELVLNQKEFGAMESQHVADCCHIGHYLQCPFIVEGTAQILLDNVDSDNCLSICQLADQLELPDLFERALFHMLKSLTDLETQEAYESFSPELKDRIANIRAVFSTHPLELTAQDSALRKKTTLYFTSLEEYIAIFAENVQYHRERLEEAKEQNAADYNSYAQSKIDKQELRVLTLEAMLQEQKRMFGKKQQQQQQPDCWN